MRGRGRSLRGTGRRVAAGRGGLAEGHSASVPLPAAAVRPRASSSPHPKAPPPSLMRWDAHSAAGEGAESGFSMAPLAESRDATFEAFVEAVAFSFRMPAPPLSCPAIRSATTSRVFSSMTRWTPPGPWARATSSSTAPRGMWSMSASPLQSPPRDLLPLLPSEGLPLPLGLLRLFL